MSDAQIAQAMRDSMARQNDLTGVVIAGEQLYSEVRAVLATASIGDADRDALTAVCDGFRSAVDTLAANDKARAAAAQSAEKP